MSLIRRVLVVVALLAAWAMAGSDRKPLNITLSEATAAPARFADPDDQGPKGKYDLSALRVFSKVVLYVKDNYVDPKRVHPKEMMVQSMEYVEKAVPDVMVDGNADTGHMKLNVNGKLRDFDISHVDSLWKMSFMMKDVFDFVSKNMRPAEDPKEIEYAAVNGMLSTLDPHSVLLRPEMYREMKLTTKGEFGGLGFVIQMKEGNLTVVKVLPKTPAFRAGIKKDDQIKKISEESTVNMDLNEAVSKLRGAVDSKVTITIERKGWDKPQSMTLTRAQISIESVQSKMLASNVGYVRLKNFQGNTGHDLQKALAELDQNARDHGSPTGIKGLVLDLRGNPGGLLEQAIMVSDMFVSQGTIVATVGFSDKLREEKKAHADEGDEQYPIAVLVNAGSASASEIVAGALKNLNRAVIIGRQTFGKGSVQVLYDFPDDSALKLTIAKYLTPGDVSIQEVGITPDIELVPTRVTKERLDVWAPRRTLGEADLEHHFSNPSNATAVKKREELVFSKPAESMKYLKDEPKKVEKKDAAKDAKGKHPLTDAEQNGELDDELDAETAEEIKEDYEVTFARDFVVASPYTKRDKMVEMGKNFVAERRKTEDDRIASAISALGVDWSAGPTPKKPELALSIKPGADHKIAAGETVQMDVTAENKGSEAVHRLRGWTDSDNGFLDRREFVFGLLKPGEKKTWSVSVKMPKDLTSRRDGVTLKVQDDSGTLPETTTQELSFVELPRPAFAYDYQIIDDCQGCNGDGIVQRGEDLTLLIDVTNIGKGKALDSYGSIKNASSADVFIEKGRFKLGELAPGETKTARFQLQVKKGYKPDDFAIKMYVIDEQLEEFTADKLTVPIASDEAAPVALEARKGTVKLNEKANVYISAAPDARVLGTLPKGAVLNEQARGSSVARVELEQGRFGFVKLSDERDAKGVKAAPAALSYLAYRTPPEIDLSVDRKSVV